MDQYRDGFESVLNKTEQSACHDAEFGTKPAECCLNAAWMLPECALNAPVALYCGQRKGLATVVVIASAPHGSGCRAQHAVCMSFLLTFFCSNLNMISSGNQESWRFEPGTR